MDVLDQIQQLIKQASENNKAIEDKMKWFANKQKDIQDRIQKLEQDIIHSKQYIQDQKAKYMRQLDEYKAMGEKYKQDAIKDASEWIDTQKDLLLKKLQQMIQTVLKAKTL